MSNAKGIGRPVEVLLIEDNPGDADLVREGLEEGALRNVLHVVGDGEEAMAFLRQQGKYKDVRHPDLILLDLNLPRKDGREVLAEIKADDKLRRIPVVVLTSSQAEHDIVKSYQLHANCYIPKPIGFAEFVKIVQAIESFWFTIVRLPTDDAA
jgi:two-component system response regulator